MSDVKKRIMRLENIKIKESFLETIPNPKKVEEYRQFYYENGETAKMITVNRSGCLVDGYIQYLILKEAGIEEVVVKVKKKKKEILHNGWSYKNVPTVYVFGKHLNSDKEYVWRFPNKWIENELYKTIKEGDLLSVSTNFGSKTITVTRVEMLDKPPVDKRVRKVIGKKVKYKKVYVDEFYSCTDEKDNNFLLKVWQCEEELNKKLPKKEKAMIMSSIYEDMRKYMKLPNKIMAVCVNEEEKKGYIALFNKEPDGKAYNIHKDDKGLFIKVYEED